MWTNHKSERLVKSGFLLAVGIILPFASAHGLGIPGTVLLPMHIPALLCGFLCGPVYGAMLGLVLPFVNSILTGMPVLYPMAIIMSLELMMYGLVCGLLCKTRIGKMKYGIYSILLLAMLSGRVVYGLTFYVLLFLNDSLKAPTVWIAIATGIPGIILQILILPAFLNLVRRQAHQMEENMIESAKIVIREGRATCIVIKDSVIIKTLDSRGIAHLIQMYEDGLLQDALVVDKIIGKASAMIFTLAGVRRCYGITVDRGAVLWMKEKKIPLSYDTCVETIINREGTGSCPMELAVANIEEEKEAIVALKEKIEEMRGLK